ncbi:MAG TPA: polysaccharide biosynthesis C-terminal domain-containing protein [Bacteroidales bacterium]|nr:polysaccharide biosynthesis C-terminal domain-containing protein [Bacteroidales bacterium]
MSEIKKLAGQTAVYGIPLILGRILSYLLVPLYTNIFQPDLYGTVSVFYSYSAFLLVALSYGMETAFFRYSQQKEDKVRIYSTAMLSLILTTIAFLIAVLAFAGPIADFIDYANHKNYVVWFAFILALDTLSAIPFARLRSLNRPGRFAKIKMTGIVLNIGLNLFFILLCPWIYKNSEIGARLIRLIYRPDWNIEYIFISNLISSGLVLVLLIPEIFSVKWQLDKKLWRKMLIYAFPLLFAGMAGIVNETFDRLMLRYLLPVPTQDAEYQVGVYSGCYKIAILMTIFIQAYRYAAEPFFFAQAKQHNAKDVYADVMNYFIIVVSLIFLGTMVYLDDFVLPLLVGKKYHEGRAVIPILMMAHLFLGIYYNLSVWYKLADKTIWGAWFSVIGAIITFGLNFWWIPRSSDHILHGYYGSAWAAFICYGAMMLLSYIIGQRYFPVRYNLSKFFIYTGLATGLYLLTTVIKIENWWFSTSFHTMLIIIFLSVAIVIEKPPFIKFYKRS